MSEYTDEEQRQIDEMAERFVNIALNDPLCHFGALPDSGEGRTEAIRRLIDALDRAGEDEAFCNRMRVKHQR